MRVLRPSTPGGHALIAVAWIAALVLAGASFAWPDAAPLAALVAAGAFAAYMVRHARFVRTLDRIERHLRLGEAEAARALAAPLLARFPTLPLVQKAAADVLYATGDPLSAASLYERAAQRLPRDAESAVGLVASYAALNKAGDARRAATLAPTHPDVRLALAWSELVALAGDRAAGRALAREIRAGLTPAHGAERTAMTHALAAIAFALDHRAADAREELELADRQGVVLEAADRAFVGYLGGIALRELGLLGDARATFERAMEAAPGSIGEALARRERSHLAQTSSSSSSSSSSSHPSADSRSSAN